MQHSFHVLLLWLLLSNIIVTYIPALSYYHIEQAHIDPQTLSIVSFGFHDPLWKPRWVQKLFGSEAVFWNTSLDIFNAATKKPNSTLLYWKTFNLSTLSYFSVPVDSKARKDAHVRYVRRSKLGPFPTGQTCSIELLGYARLGTHAPFRVFVDRFHRPPTGFATLHMQPPRGVTPENNDPNYEPWKCYYRAVYSNRRVSEDTNSYWPVFIYCPAQMSGTKCGAFEWAYTEQKTVSYQLIMQLRHGMQWRANFDTYFDDSMKNGEKAVNGIKKKHEKIAICSVWPYATAHSTKVDENRALVYEFLRYYSTLGFKVMIYDRDGANINGVFESAYARANPQTGAYKNAIFEKVIYNNYTLHGLLMPTKDVVRSDMETKTKQSKTGKSVIEFDNDKILTYTLCRFEAMYRYGIKEVIIADFDEFLYCKGAPSSTPESQAHYINKLLHNNLKAGYDQLLFGKTTVAARKGEGSVHHCISKEVRKNTHYLTGKRSHHSKNGSSHSTSKKGSIFNCFSSINYILSIANKKSLHLNHACPYTGIHHACSPTMEDIKAYDCTCNSVFSSECDFVHISLVEGKYKSNKLDTFDQDAVKHSSSELWNVANGNNRAKPVVHKSQ